MRFIRILIVAAVLGIFAGCTGDHHSSDPNTPPPSSETPTLLASGGTSTSGSGGAGGYVYVQSYGSAKVLKSGTVDASFPDPGFSPTLADFGTAHAIVSSDTTVLIDGDDVSGNLCNASWDSNLYIGDGNGICDGNDILVTGLTVNAGATLTLADQGFGYATLRLTNDLVINGTLTTDVNINWGLDLEANIISVGSGGKITASATTVDWGAGEIWIGSGSSTTNQIINRGTIEAKGLGSGNGGYMYFYVNDFIVNYGTIDASGGSSATGSGGNAAEFDIYLNSSNDGEFYSSGTLLAKGGDSSDSSGGSGGTGGYIYIDVPDLVVNTGTIDVSGGTSDFGSGGSGGAFDVIVDYGDFYSSGTVRMNGGKGATNGGDTEYWNENWTGYSAYIETAYNDNSRGRNGDIINSGAWEANGGDGSNGYGGYGGYIYLETDAMGAVTINATMSVRGGDSLATGFPGGSTYGIDIYSYNYYTAPTSPGKIRLSGKYDFSGGDGDESGGNGGYLYVYSDGYNASNIGVDVELVGFAAINLNGGEGASGGNASSQAFEIYTYSAGNPAGPITNEAYIEAKGGKATEPLNTGGSGGYVEMRTGEPSDSTTIINNSGNIDISGGTGDMGGTAYGGGFGDALHLQAQHVTNSGDLTANGGNGTTSGGNGGNITLNSQDTTTPTTNTGTLSVNGGTGSTAGLPGTVTIDGSGGPI